MGQKYDVVVDTPKYHRLGRAEVTFSKDTALVKLEVEDFCNFEASGTREDKNFEVSGVADIEDVGSVEFTAKGQTWANSLDCSAETSMGTVTIYGTAIGQSAGDVPGAEFNKYYAGNWSDSC